MVACKQRPPLPHEVKHEDYPVLAAVSRCYPDHQGRSPTRYSPVRRSTQDRSPFLARLACVKHASSVQSEPGSNSPVKNCEGLTCIARILLYKFNSPNSLFNCQRPWSLSQSGRGNSHFFPLLSTTFFNFLLKEHPLRSQARWPFPQRRGAFLCEPAPVVNTFLRFSFAKISRPVPGPSGPVRCGEGRF